MPAAAGQGTDEKRIPVLLATPDRQAEVVMISCRYGHIGALVSLPGVRVCRADPKPARSLPIGSM